MFDIFKQSLYVSDSKGSLYTTNSSNRWKFGKLCFNSVPKAGFISFVICKISQKLNQFNFLLQRYQLVSSDTKIEIDYLVIVALGVID